MSLVGSNQVADNDVLKKIDRQRLVSQHILSEAAGISFAATEGARRATVNKLDQDLRELLKSQSSIDRSDLEMTRQGIASERTRDLYSELRVYYGGVLQSGQSILESERIGPSSPGSYQPKVRQLAVFQGKLESALERLLLHYRRQADNRLEHARVVDLGVGCLTLLVLAIEFFFVFKPELRSLGKLSSSLAELNVELIDKNGALVERSLELSRQQVELEEQRQLLAVKNSELRDKQAELENLNHTLDDSQEAYASAARQMEEVFQTIPIACFAFDREGKVSEWNRASEVLFGVRAHEALGQPLAEVLKDALMPEDLERMRHVFNGKAVESLVWQHRPATGEPRWMLCSAHPVHAGGQSIQTAICCSVDISDRMTYASQLEESMVQLNEYSLELEMQRSELEDMNVKLEALATTDGLTGLRNHRNFQERLEFELNRAKDKSAPLSILLMDVDKFKVFNDTYGHPEGDKVLQVVGAVLKGYAQEPNTAARYGGEEFVLVLPGVNEANADKIAEEIRLKIEAAKPSGIIVTASFGLACWSPGMRSRAELIAQADKALYMSKAAGRNRVTLASSLWNDEVKDAA